jgi:hypothetical protein
MGRIRTPACVPTCGYCACTGSPGRAAWRFPGCWAAAEQLGYRAAGTPVDNAVTELLRQAVNRLGESREATAAERSFDRFAQYAGGHDPKRLRRRPRPFETLVETARRFRDLNHLRAALDGLRTSCVLGGSVNYSRYFNVRGQGGELPGPSVDIMLVIPDLGGQLEVGPGLLRTTDGAR